MMDSLYSVPAPEDCFLIIRPPGNTYTWDLPIIVGRRIRTPGLPESCCFCRPSRFIWKTSAPGGDTYAPWGKHLQVRHDVKLHPQLVFHLYRPAAHADGFDSEVPLFQLCRALIVSVFVPALPALRGEFFRAASGLRLLSSVRPRQRVPTDSRTESVFRETDRYRAPLGPACSPGSLPGPFRDLLVHDPHLARIDDQLHRPIVFAELTLPDGRADFVIVGESGKQPCLEHTHRHH